ncbi:MAG: hypothetical protein AB7F86_18095 [Bdellovibrionales bacterium]
MIELEWEPVPKASSYEVRLMPKSGKPLKFRTKESRVVEGVPVGSYNLQVRTYSEDADYYSPWSDPLPLEVVEREITLLQPADESVIEAGGPKKQTVEFVWEPVKGVKDYTLKVWNEKRVDTPWVFKTRATSKKLDIPPAEIYSWQVLFESAGAVSYAQSPTTFKFTLLGHRLTKPEINPPELRPGRDRLSWKPSPGAATYKAVVYYHHIDETDKDWKPFHTLDDKKLGLIFPRLKRGFYKIEVQAKAPKRADSEVSTLEFYLKPSQEELMAALPGLQPIDSNPPTAP